MKLKFIILTILFPSLQIFAQDDTSAKTIASSNNQLAIMLIVVMLLLAFVIWGLGKALIELSKQVMQKNKSNTKNLIVLFLIISSFYHQSVQAQYSVVEEVVKVKPNYGGLSATSFYLFSAVIVLELIAIAFLTISIKRMYAELVPAKTKTSSNTFSLKNWWGNIDKKYFTRAVPIEQEADTLLDHDYDGIRELDNALPPWWKYGFYITIFISIIYLTNFHVLNTGKNPTEEYADEMHKAQVEKEIFEANNKDKIDEKNIVMADAIGLQKGAQIFATDCWACHGKKGEGGAGPNLTDDYWLHSGSLNDIYLTIKNGYPDKGMQAWSVKFTPKEMSQIASYVKSLKGTNPPNAKAAQGDFYTDITTDSTTTK
jgi:cytochrome c oxidase cbb3-type subunit III